MDDLQVVRHRCDNPACVNPEHLEAGTQRDNIFDAVRRKRKTLSYFGEKNGRAKLTSQDVREVRRMIDRGVLKTQIAKKFSVHPQIIYRIGYGKTWKGV